MQILNKVVKDLNTDSRYRVGYIFQELVIIIKGYLGEVNTSLRGDLLRLVGIRIQRKVDPSELGAKILQKLLPYLDYVDKGDLGGLEDLVDYEAILYNKIVRLVEVRHMKGMNS